MPRLRIEGHERIAREIANNPFAPRAEAAARLGLGLDQLYQISARDDVRARVAELSDALLKAADITAERVMLELGRLAFRDVRRAYDPETGALLPVHELDDDIAAALQSVEHETRSSTRGPKKQELDLATGQMVDVASATQTVTTKVKFAAKDVALTTLAKRFKLIGDEGDGVNALASALADRLKTARKRAAGEPQDETSN